MIFGLRKRPSISPGKARVPDRSRIYVVGDVHGRDDLLDNLTSQIAADVQHADCDESLAIFLGDYIDRGPSSAAVIERLSSETFPTKVLLLRGNHEEMLLNFLEDETILDLWRRNGGLETLTSYNVDVKALLRGHGYKLAQQAFRALLPEKHLECLKTMNSHFCLGDYFFCHAGVRPGVSLDNQNDSDLLWIREEFLTSDWDFGKIVVHGHTPVSSPDIRQNRINIDTGAFATNRLTCLVLQGTDRRFFCT
jgi:serine/threonine protein phosphatase 1